MAEAYPKKRVVDQPQPGLFKMRLVRRGPFVPAKIEKIDGKWTATINGAEQWPPSADPVAAAGVLRIWHGAAAITAQEYEYLIELKAWAEASAPEHPAANPTKPIDLSSLPPVYQRQKDIAA